jgi:DtxR family transcriptional regulator, Mn-dependent transcriptional regulator
MKYQQSEEDYLEKILMLSEDKQNIHSIDIANEMGFSKPSVSIAMHKLADKGLINMEKNGVITLTDEGYKKASAVYERHKVISEFFMSIGISKETALEDACEIEHFISEETFNAIKNFKK